jgi:hypothetical protein
MRELGRSERFPPLPKVDLVLHRSARRPNPAVEAMADFIVHHFANSALAPSSRVVRTQAGSGSHDWYFFIAAERAMSPSDTWHH